MTYCFGFKYKNDVFLYADSALTESQFQPDAPTLTTFGEETVRGASESVYEAALKIHKISEKCFVAISGNDFFRAHDMVDTLRDSHRENQDFSETIKFLNNSLGLIEEETGREVAFLIASCFNGTTSLYKWLSFQRKLELIHDCCSIGSLPNDNQKPIIGLYNFCTKSGTIAESALLVGMAAGLQSISLKGKFLNNHNAGGTITGLKLSDSGVEWLGDTMYAISGNDGKIYEWVMVANRDNGFATRSSYTNKSNYFLTINRKDVEAWMNKWHSATENVFNSSLALNWVLMNPLNNVIIVIQAEQPTSRTSVCYVEYEGSEQSIPILDAAGEILENASHAIFVFTDDTALNRLEAIRTTIRVHKLLNNSQAQSLD